MSTATNFLREALAAHVLTGTAYTAPTTLYLALFTTATDETGAGTEVTGGSYVRQTITFTSTTVDGEYENDSVAFTDMPEVTVTGLAIMDASTAGNMLYFANFSPVSVAASASYPVDAGVLTIRHV